MFEIPNEMDKQIVIDAADPTCGYGRYADDGLRSTKGVGLPPASSLCVSTPFVGLSDLVKNGFNNNNNNNTMH